MKNEYIKDPDLLEMFRKYLESCNEGHMYVKKLKHNYKIYCTSCRSYHSVSKETLYKIKKSGVCLFCYNDIKLHYKDLSYYDKDLVREDDTGYWITIHWRFGFRKPHVNAVEVIRYQEGYVLKRHVYMNMYRYYFDSAKSEFRRLTNSRVPNWVEWLGSIDKDSIKQSPIRTKKDYVTEAVAEFIDYIVDVERFVKSNQIKLMKDGLFNKAQISYLIAFDLKTPEEVYKYNRYYKSNYDYFNGFSYVCEELRELVQFNNATHEYKQLNVHYLDYLYRNKIRLGNYVDYAKQCRKLNYKLDKPTDFNHRHAVLSAILTEKNNKENNNKIKKRYKALAINSYEDKKTKISIRPFNSVSEIVYAGKFLQNCIASNYMKPYAEGETDLYHLDVDGVMTVAIEVHQNRLLQAYAAGNKLPDSAHKRIINSWIQFMKKERRRSEC